jgi:hypothetical protein
MVFIAGGAIIGIKMGIRGFKKILTVGFRHGYQR